MVRAVSEIDLCAEGGRSVYGDHLRCRAQGSGYGRDQVSCTVWRGEERRREERRGEERRGEERRKYLYGKTGVRLRQINHLIVWAERSGRVV